MKLVFCGTPAFAVPALKAVLSAGHTVELVVSQPDRPSGRGMQTIPTPVKQAAIEAGLSVVQPTKIKNNPEFQSQLEAIRPDAIIVVAYGRIIPRWMLDLPPLGNINVHASLLPKYRGAAPIQWAVANGEPVTGVTTMRIDEGLDTGDMLLQREMAIAPDQTAADLFPLLSAMGSALLIETLDGLAAGTIQPGKQDESQASHAPILTRDDGRVDFHRTAWQIYNRWRGFYPWPGAHTELNDKKITFHRVAVTEHFERAATSGSLLIEGSHLFAACGDNTWLEILELQLEGRRRMMTSEFLRGSTLKTGDRLG
ncbi:methionyl-tRNA formyltransferase [Acidipila rosea]|uniref:Methionyl-tRNA formyltransferase n=1 Tax=Acidipila rosea TaxID=768535 RepID=A0A4V2PVS6_9BACT|nr:methionyl-tRNA formyltransferase [Acidipila rosea]TCK75331.1 methionyl-tRNA formyltransferase [Acidipila rosea]